MGFLKMNGMLLWVGEYQVVAIGGSVLQETLADQSSRVIDPTIQFIVIATILRLA